MSRDDEKIGDDPQVQVTTSGLLARFGNSLDITPVVTAASVRSWKKVSISGNPELAQAFWLEATVAGLQVHGYKPSLAERELAERRLTEKQRSKSSVEVNKSANAIARDLRERVIPALKKQIETISSKRQANAKSGGDPSETARKDKFYKAQSISYNQAIFRLERSHAEFESFGAGSVKARKVVDHGIVRYELVGGKQRTIDYKEKDLDRTR